MTWIRCVGGYCQIGLLLWTSGEFRSTSELEWGNGNDNLAPPFQPNKNTSAVWHKYFTLNRFSVLSTNLFCVFLFFF